MEFGGFMFDPSCFQSGNMLFLGNGGDSLFRGTNTLMELEQISKRRSFFETSDMLYDEDYYDDQLPDKKRRLTSEQVQLLEKSFEIENKLEPERKAQLAKKLGLQPRQVAIWFQNRRARWKTKQLKRDYDLLKSSYGTLLSNLDSIKKQNQKLKLVVLYDYTRPLVRLSGQTLYFSIASLYKKLQSKEISTGATAAVKFDALQLHEPLQVSIKAEDRLSSGSGGSAVVDDDGPPRLDSCNSCFPGDEFNHCMAAVQWEEEYGNHHSSTSYFPEAFPASNAQIQEEGVPLGWFPLPKSNQDWSPLAIM